MTLLIAPNSFIQGPFLKEDPVLKEGVPNFEAVVFVPERGELQHYYRENHRPDRNWQKARIINTMDFPVVGPGALCQSNFGSKGNFELVVPESAGLVHYWHDNDQVGSAWIRTGLIAPGSVGAGAILQNRKNNDLEVVVRHGRNLVHYWRSGNVWGSTSRPITTNASGPAALIQSSYADNLELIVQEGVRLVLYFRPWNTAGQPWTFGGIVAERATGAPGFVQGKFGSGPHNNFEVVFPVDDRLELRWRDNSPSGGMTWKPGGIVAHGAGIINAVALTRSSSKYDQLDLITQECWESVFQYYRFQEAGGERVWMRNGCLRIHEGRRGQRYPDPRSVPQQSFKINQMTGARDDQIGKPTLATNPDTGIRGTDLGPSFEHNGNLYFLFGDTHWVNHFPPGMADSLAFTPDNDPWNGVALYFHRSYLCVRFPGKPAQFDVKLHGEYDVPQDAFSFGGQIFAFFSTDHFNNGQVMSRSVFARCDTEPDVDSSDSARPLTFQYLTEFSRRRFINVSVQRVSAAKSRMWGLPGGREGLLIWGTGAYRLDPVSLAFMSLDDEQVIRKLSTPFNKNPTDVGDLGVFYYSGQKYGRSQWSLNELDATPLFYPAAIGELSVRWDGVLRAFVMMYMSGPEDPIGASVVMRLSKTPWGPWSDRRMVFNWILDGLGFRDHSKRGNWFIHVDSCKLGFDDGLGDDIIDNRGPEQGGAAYAPYQIPRYTRQDSGGIHIFYALSTWNPYQVVLMRHALTYWDRFWLLGGWNLTELVTAITSWVRSILENFVGSRRFSRDNATKSQSDG